MAVVEFETWYRREHPYVVNSLFLMCGSVHTASDAADEAFIRAAARWERVSTMESPRAWVFRVAVNLVRREHRRNRRESAAYARLNPERHGGVLVLPDPQVWAAVNGLPDRQRETVVLRYVADMTEVDIANVLGVARGTVSSNLTRGLSTLRAALTPLTDGEAQ